jgi:inosose dehydratase
MFTRRLLLQTAGLAAAAASLPTRLSAAPEPNSLNCRGNFSLGFSLYGMKSVPLTESLQLCRDIGYEHVEFCLNPGFPTEPSSFTAAARTAAAVQLKQLRLELPCLMVLMNLTASNDEHRRSLELIAAAAQLARDLDPARPAMLETVLGGSPAKWMAQRGEMADRLRDWAAAAEQANTTILLKAHVGSAVNSPDRLLWLFDQVPSPALQAAYDYSHFELQGIDLAESLKLLLPRTRFIHVKDSEGTAAKFRFLLPGTGRTDYVKYFSLLNELQYSGPVCVEVSGQVSGQPGYDPKAAALQCWTALSGARQTATGNAVGK